MVGDVQLRLQQFSREQEEAKAQEKAAELGLPYVNLVNYPFVSDVLNTIPNEKAQQLQVVAFARVENTVRVACLDPYITGLPELINQLTSTSNITFEPYIASQTSINYGLNQFSRLVPPVPVAQPLPQDAEATKRLFNLQQFASAVNKASTTELFETILSGAVAADASDIHFEPMEKAINIRFRVDGKLLPILSLEENKYKLLSSRIKTSAAIKLDLKHIAQDGRLSIKVGDEPVDIRVNVLPSAYGETIELRLLRRKNFLTLDQLQLPAETKDAINKSITRPEGLVLFTGPTGSGKTTSLYAVLQQLNTPEKKIMTIEDPVEYHLDGIEQIQINAKDNFDFADALRAVLRQDPDIIMVGEIRDKETAEIAVNAALTGHLVFSTLHTNSAVAAFTRLLQMGVPKYLLTDAVVLVVAQRLIRKLCTTCNGTGCDACHTTGFSGRMVIAEHYIPSEKTADLIKKEATLKEFENEFNETGNKTILQDGLERVANNLTTEAEVRSVV